VRGAAELVSTGRFPLGTAASPASPEILDTPSLVKVVVADDGRALYFSRAPIPFLRDKADAAAQAARTLQHIGVYAYSRDALARWVALPVHPLEEVERLEQLRPLAAGVPMGVAITTEAPASGIDTEDDLQRANARWEDFMSGMVKNAS
jgi:3-deoxy-manno-octulosonate cytidylyltransferase (CMP-KDO synthetase)